MQLSGKKLTTAILAGLMGATVTGLSMVGAANPVVLDGTTLKVFTAGGARPIMNPVNVKKGIIDGSTTDGKFVKANKTVGDNLTALDAAVVGKADKADLATKADTSDLNVLKNKVDSAKVDTALHVDGNGKLVVGTDKKVNKPVSVDVGFKDGTTEAGQGGIVAKDKTIGQNLTALDTAIAADKQAADKALATKADKADLDKKADKADLDKKADKTDLNKVEQTVNDNSDAIAANTAAIGTTKDGNYVKAENSVGQNLNALDEQVGQNSANINRLFSDYSSLKTDINKVGARSAALAGLHPLDFDPDNKWDFAAGYGNYAGANAVAIGTYYRPNENTMFSIGGSFGGGENMINAGVSFKLGSGGSGITTSKTVMAKKIKEQDELLKAQDAKMKEQDEKIAKLEALVAQQGEMIQQALGKK